MDQPLLLALRIVHILLGVFWAGVVFFVATLLLPAVGEAGPDGAKVMGALTRRGMLNILPVAGVLTVLSGLWMLWLDSSGFEKQWMGSPMGITLSIGALLAIVGLTVGIVVMRASALKAGALMQSMPQTPEGPARDAAMAQVQALRARGAAAGKTVAILLAGAVICMAVARYV